MTNEIYIGPVRLSERQSLFAQQYRYYQKGIEEIPEEDRKFFWFSSRIGWNTLMVREQFIASDLEITLEKEFRKETGWELTSVEKMCPARLEYIIKGFINRKSILTAEPRIDKELYDDHLRLFVPQKDIHRIQEQKIVDGTKVIDVAGNKYVLDVVIDKIGLVAKDHIVACMNPDLDKRKNRELFMSFKDNIILYVMEDAEDLMPSTKLKLGIVPALLERAKDFKKMENDLVDVAKFYGMNSVMSLSYLISAFQKQSEIKMATDPYSPGISKLRLMAQTVGRRNKSVSEYYDKFVKAIGLDKVEEYAYTEVVKNDKDGNEKIETIPNSVGWGMFLDMISEHPEGSPKFQKMVSGVARKAVNNILSPTYDMSSYVMAIPGYRDSDEITIPRRVCKNLGLDTGDEVVISRYPVHTGNNIQKVVVKASDVLKYAAEVPIDIMEAMDGDFDGDRIVIYKLPKSIIDNCSWERRPAVFDVDKYEIVHKIFGNHIQDLPGDESSYVINRRMMKIMTPLAASIGRSYRWTSVCQEELVDANRVYWELTNSVLNTKTIHITDEMVDILKQMSREKSSPSICGQIVSGRISVLYDYSHALEELPGITYWDRVLEHGLKSVDIQEEFLELTAEATRAAVRLWKEELADVMAIMEADQDLSDTASIGDIIES